MRDLYHWEQARFRKPWKYVKVEQEAGLLIRSSSEDNDDCNKNGKKKKRKKISLRFRLEEQLFYTFLCNRCTKLYDHDVTLAYFSGFVEDLNSRHRHNI